MLSIDKESSAINDEVSIKIFLDCFTLGATLLKLSVFGCIETNFIELFTTFLLLLDLELLLDFKFAAGKDFEEEFEDFGVLGEDFGVLSLFCLRGDDLVGVSFLLDGEVVESLNLISFLSMLLLMETEDLGELPSIFFLLFVWLEQIPTSTLQ